MKKIPILTLILIFNCILGYGLGGSIHKNQVIESEILSEEVKFNIYLPPQYNASKEFPVLYYLHGFGGNNSSSLKIMKIVDSLIVNHNFPNIIIVTPNAKKTWYLDNFDGSVKYSSMFIKEFKPFIEKKYSVTKSAEKTIISGSSMGGFGAMRFSMLYPEQFGICIGFQSAIDTEEQFFSMPDSDYKVFHQHIYGKIEEEEKLVRHRFRENNPVNIAQKLSDADLNKVKWYIQCCDDDYHSAPNAQLHILFFKRQIEHEYRVNDGTHNGKCVMSSITDALEFVKNKIP